MRFEVTPQADADLYQHVAYLRSHSPDAAARFVEAVFDTVNGLLFAPQKAPVLELSEPQLFAVRWQVVKGFRHYRLVYRVMGDTVEILKVFHTSQNPERLRGV
jgi:plasmid stabilization system protein ParE